MKKLSMNTLNEPHPLQTLKRYYIDRKLRKIRLHPENEKYEDMLYDNVRIQGIAVKIIKDIE